VRPGLTDKQRVGISGWSYCGWLSALCLVKEPEVFHVAVADAPVINWDGLGTHYTERYMGGTPKTNPGGYEHGAVMKRVGGLQGKLMLVHGLIDENVHVHRTAR
jgi:dipeptidyl-peptidase-4